MTRSPATSSRPSSVHPGVPVWRMPRALPSCQPMLGLAAGGPLPSTDKVAMYGQYGMFTPEILMLSMTHIIAGERDFGTEMAWRFWEDIVLEQRHPWDGPNVLLGDTGVRTYGTDYSQNMIIWTLPAVILGEDLRTFCRPGGLVDRIITAGGGQSSAALDLLYILRRWLLHWGGRFTTIGGT